MNILLTASGTGTAFGYALAMSSNFANLNLYTADTNSKELVTSSLFSKMHIQVDEFSHKNHLQCINQLTQDYNIDVYLPFIDEEIAFVSKHIDEVEVKAAVNLSEFCEAAIKKSNYTSIVEGCSIKVPKAFDESELKGQKVIVAKKDGGFGGNLTIVDSPENILGNSRIDSAWKFYECISGEEFTVDCFPLDNEKRSITSVRKRVSVKSGVSVKSHIIQDKELQDFSDHLTEKYRLTHPFCFQTIKQNSFHYLIDINPRLGGGTSMSQANGLDFQSAHLAQLSGHNPMKYLQRKHNECVVTRQYSDYLMQVVT